MSNDFKWYESMFMMMHNNPTEKVNAEYVEDIKIYLKLNCYITFLYRL